MRGKHAGTFPFYGETDEEIRLCTLNPKEPDFGADFEGISPQCISLLRDQLLAKVNKISYLSGPNVGFVPIAALKVPC
jgi:hypothetical protein